MDTISMSTFVVTCVVITLTGMCEANECFQCAWIKGLDDTQNCANPSGSTPTVECNASCLKLVGKIGDSKIVARQCSVVYAASLDALSYPESLKNQIRQATDCSEPETHIEDVTGSLTVSCCATDLCNIDTTTAAGLSVQQPLRVLLQA